MHQVGWEEVPLVAMETTGAASLAACAKAGEWVELDDITRCVVSWVIQWNHSNAHLGDLVKCPLKNGVLISGVNYFQGCPLRGVPL